VLERFFHALWVGLKWTMLTVVGVEAFFFLVITATNYLEYGHPWEGSPALKFIGRPGAALECVGHTVRPIIY
jgi:hypothetical protein